LLGSISLASVLAAQTPATFTNYGAGCGDATNACISTNWDQPFSVLPFAELNTFFAIQFNTGASVRVVNGVELFCKSRKGALVLMNVWLYDADAAGKPNQILASSVMPITLTAMANRANFSTLHILAANTTYFIAFNAIGIDLPVMSTGTVTAHYQSGPPNWTGPISSRRWNYRVLCVGNGPLPVLSNTGLPRINSSFSVDLGNAPASSPAIFALGTTQANTNLAVVNAPACTLLTNMVIVLGTNTSPAGTATFQFGVPNNSSLAGVKFFTQWAAHAPGANGLDLVFSDGGVGTIGI
jgi:hypothetical protein